MIILLILDGTNIAILGIALINDPQWHILNFQSRTFTQVTGFPFEGPSMILIIDNQRTTLQF